MKQRSTAIDLLKGLSVLYIVGYWHLLGYTTVFRNYTRPPAALVTVAVLGLFVFISGFLVGEKREGAWPFYRKRLVRIFPPYLAAIVLYLVMNLSSPLILAKTAALVTMFSIPAPPTLWFIATIIYYYVATPLLRSSSDRALRYVVVCACLAAPVYVYGRITGMLDLRMIMYFPAFAAGVFLGRDRGRLRRWPLTLLGILALLSVALCFRDLPAIEESLYGAPLALFVPLLVFAGVTRRHAWKPHHAISVLSHASYFMYLFHRPVFAAMCRLFLPASPGAQLIFLWGLCLPLLILICWHAQSAYDRLVSHGTGTPAASPANGA